MRQSDIELGAWIKLSLTPGLRGAPLRALLSAFGLPDQLFKTSKAQLLRFVPETVVERLLATDRDEAVQTCLDWAGRPGNNVVTWCDDWYPQQLLEVGDPPPVLYCRGRCELLSRPSIAVVGSRNATPQGTRNAEQFARTLSERGLTIVSGLALGIDAAGHRGGLAGKGATIAVVGTGLDLAYPRANAELTEKIAAHGLVISEFPLGTPPLPANFPKRNRLIAGLSLGVLVVEAAPASGSLITARLAAEQGREVFAIPGSIHSPVARGCHALIKDGAKLVESAEDVLTELRLSHSQPRQAPTSNLSGPEADLLLHMGYDSCDAGTLAVRSGLTPEAVSAMLLQLELEGKIGSLPGGFYQQLM